MSTVARLLSSALLAFSAGSGAAVNGFSTTGPYGGWTVLAANPSASGHAIAARAGAIFGTRDGGRSWSAADYGSVGGSVRAIGFDPADGNRVYAVGGSQLSMSADGGVTWSKAGYAPLHSFEYTDSISTVSRLAVSPHAAGDLYITDGELSYSADAGATFETIGPAHGYVYDFAVDPATRGTIYAATEDQGFALSRDNGATWQPGLGLPFDYAGTRLAIAGDRFYLVMGYRNAAASVRYAYDRYVVYSSSDRGVHWQPTGLVIDSGVAWKEIEIVSVPQHPGSVLLRAGAKLVVSRDAGATWSSVALPDDGVAQALAVDARDAYVAILGYGVRRSSDAGATWQRARRGLPATPMNHVAAMGTTILASTPDAYVQLRPAELLRRTQQDNAWAATLLRPITIYGSFGNSDRSFLSVRNGPYALLGFVAIPGSSTAIAIVDETHILRSDDRGGTWSAVEGSPPLRPVDRFAAANDGTTIYTCGAGQWTRYGWSSGELARSRDGGVTWASVLGNVPINLGYFGCAAIVTAAGARDTVYLARTWDIGGGIVQTRDAGDSWAPVPGTDTFNTRALTTDPSNPQRIFAAASLPNFVRAIDATTGASSVVGDVLPAPPRALAIDALASPPMLYVGTDLGIYYRAAVAGPGAWSSLRRSETLLVSEIAVASALQNSTLLTLVAATNAGVQEYTLDTTNALTPVYRLYNAGTGAHLYTASKVEHDEVVATLSQYTDEGIAFYALASPGPGATPVYRFYRPTRGTHAYATTESERATLAASPDVVDEGIAYYAPALGEPGAIAVYRFLNAATGGELFTSDDDEREDILRALPQFAYQGVAFASYPAAQP